MFENELALRLKDKLDSIFIDKLDYKLMFCTFVAGYALFGLVIFGINVPLINITVFATTIWVICAFCYIIVWNGTLIPVIKKVNK